MRMKLHRNTIGGDYELYQIYELSQFADIKQLSGYTSLISDDNVPPDSNKFRKWRCINNLLRNYTPKMPIRCTESGSILQADLRYNAIDNGYYTYPVETWQDIEMIQTGVKPADWESNPNYIQIYQFSRGFNNSPQGGYNTVNVKIAICVNSQNGSFDTSANYALDSKGKFLKRFTTDTGYTFSCCASGYWNYDRFSGCLRESAGFPYGIDVNNQYQYVKHLFTRPNNTIIDYTYRSYTSYGVTGVSSNPDYNWNEWNGMKNIVSVFVHFVDNSADFYGVAQIQYDTHLDTAIPIAIEVVAFDSEWWGTSIISGGESGQGTWGNISIPTISNGTFSERSDNVSRDATDTNSSSSIVSGINTRIKGLYSINAYTIYRLTTSNIDFAHSQVPNIIKILFSENFWTNWSNKLYNPISTVLSFGYIPSEFVPYQSEMPVKRLTLGGYDVSQHIRDEIAGVVAVPEFNTQRPVSMHQFTAIDLQKYFDGYADFEPFTKCILHLPFIGNVKLDTNKIAHGKLGVEYICDVATGNVLANIWTSDYDGKSQYTASASGNCLYSLPLFASAQDGSSIGKIALGMGIMAGGIATQMPGTAISGAITAGSGAIDLATSLWNKEVSSTGTLGGNNSLISPKQVWLEIIRPIWIENMHYQLLNGIPAEMSNCIADCGQVNDSGVPYDGFLVITEIELDNVNCTDSERSEIAELLAAGVYIRGGELLE